MKCPRDSHALVFVDEGAHMRDRCPKCEGVLLDRDEVMAELGQRGGRAKVMARERLAAMAVSPLKCPRDGTAMRQLIHREVELDLCPECSALWVDHGELDKIVRKKAKGRKVAAAAGAVAAGAAVAAAGASPGKSVASALGEAGAEIAIDVVFEFAIEAIGAIFS